MINLKRNEKGITLIALIITIVVLLILAVVAIGQAQESNIVGYAQNAASKYQEAQANEVGLLSTYETQLDALTAERVVLSIEGGRLTILPATGTVMLEAHEGGEKITGTFTIEEITQTLIDDFAKDGMPTSANNYMYALNLRAPGLGEVIILITNNREFYIDGEKATVILFDVSNDTMGEAINKYTNTIGNTVENN